MAKNEKLIKQNTNTTLVNDENQVFSNISHIIEKRKFNAVSSANSQVIVMFWEIGKYINLSILEDARADYGKKILSTVSTKLIPQYGKSFAEANERIERRKYLTNKTINKQIEQTI